MPIMGVLPLTLALSFRIERDFHERHQHTPQSFVFVCRSRGPGHIAGRGPGGFTGSGFDAFAISAKSAVSSAGCRQHPMGVRTQSVRDLARKGPTSKTAGQ